MSDNWRLTQVRKRFAGEPYDLPESEWNTIFGLVNNIDQLQADNARLLAEAAEAKKNVQHDVQFQAENVASCVRQLEGERDAAETRASALAQRVERLETVLRAAKALFDTDCGFAQETEMVDQIRAALEGPSVSSSAQDKPEDVREMVRRLRQRAFYDELTPLEAANMLERLAAPGPS